MKKLLSIIVLVMVIFFLAGCAKPKVTPETAQTAEITPDVQPVKELPETTQTADATKDIKEIEQDVNNKDLDNLDKDLDELSW